MRPKGFAGSGRTIPRRRSASAGVSGACAPGGIARVATVVAWIFAAFTMAYAAFEIPTGYWGDKLGARRVLLQLRRAVDAVPRRGEEREHRRIGRLQLEDDRVGVRRRDVVGTIDESGSERQGLSRGWVEDDARRGADRQFRLSRRQ